MFSENEYYREFKKTRNKFRKFQYPELIKGCFEYLHTPTPSTSEYLQRRPWLVLLFVKWLLLDDYYPNCGKIIASKNDLEDLLRRSYKLIDETPPPTEYDDLSLFFRSLAYQQLPYQSDFGYSHLARQSFLFDRLCDNHLIKTQFKELTGVGIQDFLDLSWVLIFRFIANNETRLSISWFGNLKTEYPQEMVEKYLKAVSVPIEEASRLIKEEDGGERKSTEHYELTPFVKFPLLKINNEYLVTEKHDLYRRIEHFIYDRLRQWGAEEFMSRFGGLFERYVEHSITESGVKFSTESQIRKELGELGKQIDFIIHEKDANVFIEAKGVALGYKGRVTHSASTLGARTKPSILKAIRQAHDVIKKMAQTSQSKIPSQQQNYLFVVTYKEFYLGNGQSYYEVVAQEKMDEIYRQYDGYPVINPENIYFITIDELDYVCAMVRKGAITVSEIIEIAKEADKSPEIWKFAFIQHLLKMPQSLETPHFLAQKKDRIFEKLRKILG